MEKLQFTQSNSFKMPTEAELLDLVKEKKFALFKGIDIFLLETIGKGGQGVVLKVASPQGIRDHKTFALKISVGGQFLEKEIVKSLSFKHENFIEILGAETKEGLNVIAMEEAKENLLATIERISPALPGIELFEELVEQTGECLAELSKVMVHRDIKPSNILVFNRPPPFSGLIFKLSDLGISQSLNSVAGKTTTSMAAGTNMYCSEAFNITMRQRVLKPDELLAEDSFNLGVTILQFVCALTKAELDLVRYEQLEVPEGRLKKLVDDLEDEIPKARTKNFPKFAEGIMQSIVPDFPPAYRKFIGRFLEFKFEDRIKPHEIAEEFRKIKINWDDEEEKPGSFSSPKLSLKEPQVS